MLTADLYIDMNEATADGTQLDQTKLNNGTQGPLQGGWTTPVATGILKGPHIAALLDPIQMVNNGTIFQIGHASGSIKVNNHTAQGIIAEFNVNAGIRRVAMGGFIQLNFTNQTPNNTLVDMWQVAGVNTGRSVTLQLNAGGGPGNSYAINIETAPLGVTTHSNYITVVPGTTYWMCLFADYGPSSGTTDLGQGVALGAIFDWQTGLQVGTDIVTTCTNGEDISNVRWGQNEFGTDTATTFNIYEQMIVRFGPAAVFPYGPKGLIQGRKVSDAQQIEASYW